MNRTTRRSLVLMGAIMGLAPASPALAQRPERARDLGVPFDGTPGPNNAITDVAGVEVGMTTLISGSGRLVVGKGPVRTGVTVIHPRGKNTDDPVFSAWFTLNGSGEMTGTTWVEESGLLWGPVTITNTISVGLVRDAVVAWAIKKGWSDFDYSTPVVAETWDGGLNDIDGFHVRAEDVYKALDGARGGAVPEGNVGGGTGMVCNQFKGGTGTSSRHLSEQDGGFTVGVLVQCNYGYRRLLTVAGVPVGKEIPDLLPCYAGSEKGRSEQAPFCGKSPAQDGNDSGSIIIVVATDAPLLPHQLKRVAKRASLGIARMGGIGGNSSGDIFIAFSTANPHASNSEKPTSVTLWPNDRINPLFEATVQAIEEAITNAMVAAETMTGADDFRVYGLPHDRLVAALRKYGRIK